MEIGNSQIEIRKWGRGQNVAGIIRSSIFFILFYLYLWLDVDLRLIYHGAGEIINFPSFFTGWAFFKEFVSRPGGLLEYTAALLSQLFYIGWVGALVATLQAWLICLCTGYFLRIINYPRLRWVRFLAPVLLLIIYTQYTYRFTTTTALSAALLFVCLYLKMTTKKQRAGWFRPAVFLLLSIILYYLAGAAYLLFALLCAIYELMFGRRRQVGLLYLLSAAVIPYVVGVMLFGESIINAFSDLLPFSWKTILYEAGRRMVILACLVYLVLPLTALIAGLGRMALTRSVKEKTDNKFFRLVAQISSWYSRHKRLRWTVESLVLFGLAFGAVFFSRDIKKKNLFAVDYYACHKMWHQVIDSAQRHPNSFYIIHAVNRALYHSGRLNLEMFSYPQHSDTLFLTAYGYQFAYWKKFDLYSDLGLINIAQNDLTECLEVFGERPLILKRLAFVNMVKGDIGSARIFLGALSKTLFDADWANNYLERLQSDPNLAADEKIQHLRSVMLEKDSGFSAIDIENILSQLLEKNKQNRMAFEYLMAWYMLAGQLDKFVQNLDRLDDFDYTQIPRLYEEAMLVHVNRTRKPLDLHGRRFSSESHQRMDAFSQIFNRYGKNKQAAFYELAKNYGDSYLFYCIYGFSGVRK